MTPEYRKEFCPNCEAETPCTHEAELFVCDICGEDFAKYIVSRNCNVSDVSMTQDVLTDIKTSRSIENKLTDTEACNARLAEQVEQLTSENDRLASLLHDINSQLAIATDLGSKRWQALSDIYFNGEKHNTNWCKRKAKEGLGKINSALRDRK